MDITVAVDSGEGHLVYILARIEQDKLASIIDAINEKGIHDQVNHVWYPPHQVRSITYGTA